MPEDNMHTAEMPAVSHQNRALEFTGDQWHNHKHRLALIGGAVLAAAGTLIGLGVSGEFGGSSPSGSISRQQAEAIINGSRSECSSDNLSFDDVSYKGQTDEILPSYNPKKVTNNNTAANYSQLLFKHGPLGNKVDPGVEATIYAFMGYPGNHQGEVNEEKYQTQFTDAYEAMIADGLTNKKAAAALFCESNLKVVGQTVGYSADAIGKNENYTSIVPVLNSQGHISGITAEHHSSTHGEIAGITYETENQPSATGINSFYEVVVESDGTMDVLGLNPQPISKKNNHNKNENKPKTTKPQTEQQHKNSGSSSIGTTANNQGTGTSGQSSGGHHPEGGPGGTENTPSPKGKGPGSGKKHHPSKPNHPKPPTSTTTPATTSPSSTTTTTTSPPPSTTTTTTTTAPPPCATDTCKGGNPPPPPGQ